MLVRSDGELLDSATPPIQIAQTTKCHGEWWERERLERGLRFRSRLGYFSFFVPYMPMTIMDLISFL